MEVSFLNDVKVYHVTGAGQGALPDWLVRQKKKALKKDNAWRERIELLQDFEFPEASLRIKQTRQGDHIVATGVYKPQLRVWDVKELAMKFDRHSDAENVQFEILSEDWTRMVLLQADRTLEFHSQSGMHYKTRIPRFGRDLAYLRSTCDLLAVGAGNEVFRLNLDQGQFLQPWQTSLSGINVVEINPVHQLTALGGEGGVCEFWDPRARKAVSLLELAPF